MIFSNVAKAGINLISRRLMRRKVNLKAWPNDWVPFVWNRPEKKPGYIDEADLVNMPYPDAKAVRRDLSKSKELLKLNSDDPLRKILSLSHSRRSQHNKSFVEDHLDKLGLVHKVDYTMSLEAKIVNLTYTLRHLYDAIEFKGGKDRYNGHLRSSANSVKGRRNRYLYDLRELHSDRYKRLIESLNLEPKENLINVPYLRPYRKIQMRRLAIEYARDLKEKKVEEFVKSLEKEKTEFEKHKLETMKWIEEKKRLLESNAELQPHIVN